MSAQAAVVPQEPAQPVEFPPWAPLQASSPRTRALLRDAARAWSLPAGVPLIRGGEPPEGVHLLARGIVRVFHALAPESQFTVKLLSAPHALGIIEPLRGSRWAASVEALTPLEGFLIPQDKFRSALAEDHSFALEMLGEMAARFESTINASRSMGFDGCERRLIRVLLEYAAHFGRPGPEGLVIRHPLTRQRLALEIGAVRRSVDRSLASLAKQRLISLSPKGWQVLHDVEALRARITPTPRTG